MENKKEIVIGDRILTRQDLYQEEEEFRKRRAEISFEEKIKILVSLQEIAYSWGGKKDVIVWTKREKFK